MVVLVVDALLNESQQIIKYGQSIAFKDFGSFYSMMGYTREMWEFARLSGMALSSQADLEDIAKLI